MDPLVRNSARRRSRSGATVALLLLLSACGGRQDDATAAPSSSTVPGSLDADTVAVRVDQTGGFVPTTVMTGRLPLVSVYGDGRVITEGPVPAIYPGPALPNVQQRRITPEDVGLLVRAALDAGVGSATDLGRPSVSDMPSTRFTVTTGDRVERLEVYALEMTEDGPNAVLTEAQRAARTKLRDLTTELRDPPTAAGPSEPYPVPALAAIATAYPERNPPDLPSPPAAVAWPGPALPGEPIGPAADAGCVTVTGDAVRAVLASAEKANAATPWTSGGRTWSLRLRPLLPDESGCADLATGQ
jgi:hypothetical protein